MCVCGAQCTVGEHMENGRTTMTVAPGTPTAVDLPTTTTPRCRRRTLFNTKMIIIISRHIPGGSRVSSVTGCLGQPAVHKIMYYLLPLVSIHARSFSFRINNILTCICVYFIQGDSPSIYLTFFPSIVQLFKIWFSEFLTISIQYRCINYLWTIWVPSLH